MLNMVYFNLMGFVRLLIVLIAAAATLAVATLGAADLQVQVVDDKGKPVWARLEVRGPDGRT